MGAMSKTTRNNILIAMEPLLITEGLMVYPVFFNGFPLWQLLIPTSLLTLLPIAVLQDAWKTGSSESYGVFLALMVFDIGFIWIVAFSITRNHKIIAIACISVFTLLSIVVIAGGS